MKKCMVALLSTALMVSSMQGMKRLNTSKGGNFDLDALTETKAAINAVKEYINPYYQQIDPQTRESEFLTVINNLSRANSELLVAKDQLFHMKKTSIDDVKFQNVIDAFIRINTAIYDQSKMNIEKYRALNQRNQKNNSRKNR